MIALRVTAPNGQYATVEEWRKAWDDVKASG